MKNSILYPQKDFVPMLANEIQLRNAVKLKILSRDLNDPNTHVIEELGLRHGAARVDIAVVNGIIHGFELKSDCDNLKRLPHQVKIYNSVLDKITLIVCHRLASAAIKLVPSWWGIIIAGTNPGKSIEFESYRAAQPNRSVDLLSVCKLLWRDEALTLLNEFGAGDSLRRKKRALIYHRLSEMAELTVVQERVRRQLKSRQNWRVGR